MQTEEYTRIHPRFIRPVYGYVMLMLTLTGFGQMPVFKRYYIADIPGFGWLAKFYITHYLHYIAAIALLVLVAFYLTRFLLMFRSQYRITASGWFRGLLLAAVIGTGIALVIRNFPGYRFSPGVIIALDIAHLGLAVVFLTAGLSLTIGGKRWLALRQ